MCAAGEIISVIGLSFSGEVFFRKRQFPPLAVPFYFLSSFCYNIISLSLFFLPWAITGSSFFNVSV